MGLCNLGVIIYDSFAHMTHHLVIFLSVVKTGFPVSKSRLKIKYSAVEISVVDSVNPKNKFVDMSTTAPDPR